MSLNQLVENTSDMTKIYVEQQISHKPLCVLERRNSVLFSRVRLPRWLTWSNHVSWPCFLLCFSFIVYCKDLRCKSQDVKMCQSYLTVTLISAGVFSHTVKRFRRTTAFRATVLLRHKVTLSQMPQWLKSTSIYCHYCNPQRARKCGAVATPLDM